MIYEQFVYVCMCWVLCMIRCGFISKTTIDTIYSVYDRSSLITSTLHLMRSDCRNGWPVELLMQNDALKDEI